MEKLTAAHRTLPFGTWVRVVNLTNDKTVDVRIIDRGPFVEEPHHRSFACRRRGHRTRSDPESRGSASIFFRSPASPPPKIGTRVQAGAFLDPDRAERLRASLERDFGPAHLVQRAEVRRSGACWWDVSPPKEAAAALAEQSPRQNPVPPSWYVSIAADPPQSRRRKRRHVASRRHRY